MFSRPRALNPRTRAANRPVLEAFARLQGLLEQPSYSAADKAAITALLVELGLGRGDESQWVVLRRSRGQLVRRHRDGTMTVVADGRGDWIGWLELRKEAVNETATRNTARVVADVGADVLGVIEAENRPALGRFNRD